MKILQLDFEPPVLHKRKYVDYEFDLYDAINFKNEAYGLISTDDGDMFVGICIKDNYCYFDDDHLCTLDLFLDISGKNLHLFVH